MNKLVFLNKRFVVLLLALFCGWQTAVAFEITATSDPEGAGIITGTGTYVAGQTCTLTVSPTHSNFSFIYWSKNGSPVSFDEVLSFTVTEDAHYVANFSYDTYIISATASPTEGGTVEVSGGIGGTNGFYYGLHCTLTATPATNYAFVKWTKDGSTVSTEASFGFDVTVSGDYVAVFKSSTDIVQTTNFVNGWTWWSPYIEQSDNTGLTQLEQGLGNSGILIKSQTASVSNIGGGEWYGTLTALDNGKTYRVKTNAAIEVTLVGPAVSTADHTITLNSGWTWIGYPCATAMSVEEALAGFTPMEGDVLKTQGSTTTYMSGQWYGTLTTLTPGMGLMYKSNRSTNVTFTFPSH